MQWRHIKQSSRDRVWPEDAIFNIVAGEELSNKIIWQQDPPKWSLQSMYISNTRSLQAAGSTGLYSTCSKNAENGVRQEYGR